MKTREFNREAWNKLVESKNRWTVPVSSEEIAEARKGKAKLVLTPSKPVPANWFPKLGGADVLCLAGGGGQQGPLLAAQGANVTVFDNSPRQLEQDQLVAKRDQLAIKTVEGDMRHLDAFEAETFDFIFHPCSNCFVEDVRPVWKEAFRVLKKGGTMISGFSSPLTYLFDPLLEKEGILQLKFRAPYSDLTSVTPDERQALFGDDPLSFGHTLEDQIQGQIDAGFHIIGFFEDDWGGEIPLDRYLKGFVATRALKP